jgi:CubicO group peptidase (beta-lactamase class C family)
MRLQLRVYWVVAFLVFLCVGISILGCETPQVSVSDISIQGAVNHVREPDNSSNTEINILIEKDFKGNLPDDIESISVKGPQGKLPITKDDFIYYPQYRAFWISIPGRPLTGTYTFAATSGSISASATDTQTVLTEIPIPKTSTFSPAAGKTLTCKSPVFSWDAVAAEIPIFYRLEINDMQDSRVFASSYIQGMDSIRTPADQLKAGATYRWRIRAVDGSDWIVLNNRSNSEWRKFSVGQTLDECEYIYEVPETLADGWETASLAEAGVNQEIISALMGKILNGNLPNIQSILLIKNGNLVLEEYFNGYARNAKHNMASATKSITSILVGIAIEKQMIPNVNTKVYEFIPEYKGTKWVQDQYDISLKQVLTMTAGLDWNEWQYPYGDMRNTNTAMNRSDNPIKFVLNLGLAETPGKKFTYCGGLSLLLSGIIKNTSGLYADKFAEKYLFGPLGIKEYRWERYDDGTICTHGNIFMRSRDMAKIGQMMLKRGQWKDHQIVSRKWVDESTKAYTSGNVLIGSGYAYHWWIGNNTINDQIVDAFYAAGKAGQYIFVIPALDLVTIITSKFHENPLGEFRASAILVDYIIPAMLPPITQGSIKLKPSVADKYAGDYKNKLLKLKLKIIRKEDKLYGEGFLFGDRLELLPVAKNQFIGFSNDLGKLRLTFREDEKGRMKGLNLDIGFSRLEYETTKWF